MAGTSGGGRRTASWRPSARPTVRPARRAGPCESQPATSISTAANAITGMRRSPQPATLAVTQLPPPVDRRRGGWIDTLAGPGTATPTPAGSAAATSRSMGSTTDAGPAETCPVDRHQSPTRPRRCRGAREPPPQGSCGCPARPGDRRRRHQCQVERAVVSHRFRRNSGVAGVAAEEGAVARPGDHPRRPQGVAGEQPSGEVPGRGAYQGELADPVAFTSRARRSGCPVSPTCAARPRPA